MNCPLCDFTFQTNSQFLKHILEAHDKDHFYFNNLIAGFNTCKECGTKLSTKQETISHISTCKTDKTLYFISKKANKRAKKHVELLGPFCLKLSQQNKPQNQKKGYKNDQRQNQQENIDDLVEDEENEEYIRFIGDTIATNGLDVGKADVGPIAPVTAETKETLDPNSVALDDEFWKQLDKIDSAMRMQNKIDIDEDGNPTCTLCKQTFHSLARLLQHYWTTHKGMLSEYK
ncbi:Zinc finger, C2H2 type family protein [Trichomonas vaginalis G3]|uniref:Zinc finger, C2H2 type family protein n=1 Tax=Trichomonas vaginalis (strain ATCC PRA-98 / G3) TaxID=412133 RepID=A2F8V4_TRIV3|nr:classic zinc finger domain-containing protein [Trichomonas vaginalis G3]EAX98636.1 Zinc finger, C2H2 type family protein [Trichomonas vaginalis G3]KAI5508450.1 classic zinc finger domain-containing protein [Trichomonas vaginalis G3]|eukprot:XP_001311566.1 Zinc finger, C2H2 type family protein [Trichomonas vaginalis G3]